VAVSRHAKRVFRRYDIRGNGRGDRTFCFLGLALGRERSPSRTLWSDLGFWWPCGRGFSSLMCLPGFSPYEHHPPKLRLQNTIDSHCVARTAIQFVVSPVFARAGVHKLHGSGLSRIEVGAAHGLEMLRATSPEEDIIANRPRFATLISHVRVPAWDQAEIAAGKPNGTR